MSWPVLLRLYCIFKIHCNTCILIRILTYTHLFFFVNSDRYNHSTIFSRRVICRQLDYTEAEVQLYPGGYFGPGRGAILQRNYRCQGCERSLRSCTYTNRSQNCGHSQDASLGCYYPGLYHFHRIYSLTNNCAHLLRYCACHANCRFSKDVIG